MDNELFANLEKIHSTVLGAERIKKNLGLDTVDVVEWCKHKIKNAKMNTAPKMLNIPLLKQMLN